MLRRQGVGTAACDTSRYTMRAYAPASSLGVTRRTQRTAPEACLGV